MYAQDVKIKIKGRVAVLYHIYRRQQMVNIILLLPPLQLLSTTIQTLVEILMEILMNKKIITLGVFKALNNTLSKLVGMNSEGVVDYELYTGLIGIATNLRYIEYRRILLCNEYGKTNEEGMQIVLDEHKQTFLKELAAILDIKVNEFDPLPISLDVIKNSSDDFTEDEIDNLLKFGFIKE